VLSERAFPIGKTGNNSILDVQEGISAKVPQNFPEITDLLGNSVSLRSNSVIHQRGQFFQAEFRIFIFRDRYPNLVADSFAGVKTYFSSSTETSYEVIRETSDRLVLLGQNSSSVVGIIIAHDGRGLVFVGQNYEIIKQGILDTMNGVVFQ